MLCVYIGVHSYVHTYVVTYMHAHIHITYLGFTSIYIIYVYIYIYINIYICQLFWRRWARSLHLGAAHLHFVSVRVCVCVLSRDACAASIAVAGMMFPSSPFSTIRELSATQGSSN